VEYLADGQTKVESFSITLNDQHGGLITRQIDVTITGTNDAPIVSATDVTGAVTEQVTPAGNLTDSGSITFTDVDLTDVHLLSATGTPVGSVLGSLTAVKDSDTTGTGTGGQLTWTYTVADSAVEYLADGQTKVESFSITLNDQHGGLITRQIDVTITGTNDAPVLSATTPPGSVAELSNASAQNLAPISGSFAVSDLDVGDTLTPSVVSSTVLLNGSPFTLPSGAAALTAAGAFALSGATSNGGSTSIGYTYDPAAANLDFLRGSDTLTITYVVKVNDGTADSNTQSVTITITGTNDAPVAVADMLAATEDTPVTYTAAQLLGNDTDVDNTNAQLSIASVTSGTAGTAVLNGNGSVTFTPNANFNGPGSFSYTATDGSATSNSATVTVNVAAVNDAPTIALRSVDIVTANFGSDNVSVLVGDGQNGFTASTQTVGGAPSSIAVGDLNQDGNPDLVTANQNSNDVSILLGNGLGGYVVSSQTVGGGNQPRSVALGDVNGDGKLDIITTNISSNNVSVLLGDGLGGFSATTTPISGGGSFPNSVAVGDFNGDGKADLVTADFFSDNVSLLIGNGLGGFSAAAKSIGGGDGPFAVTVGDINGDGKLDVVTANNNSGNVSVLIGDGLGGFSAATHPVTGSFPRSVALGDVNGDGKIDIVTALQSSGSISVLFGDGLGGFTATSQPIGAVSGAVSVTLGDLNGDGKLDIVTANNNNNISVLVGDGLGGFTVTTKSIGGGSQPLSVALVNIDKQVVAEDTNLVFSAANARAITVGDVDASGATETVTLGVLHGSLTLGLASGVAVTGGANGSGSIIFTGTIAQLNAALSGLNYAPTLNYYGDDTLTVTIDDGGHTGGAALTATKLVAIKVAAVNDAPVAVADTLAATEDTAVTYTAAQLLGNDTDVDNTNAQLSIASVTSGAGGTAVLNGNGTVTFTPNANFNGPGSFSYTATDGSAQSNSAAATVNVGAVNDAPVAVVDTLAATEDTQVIYTATQLLGNDTDVDNTNVQLSIASVTSGTGGTAVLNGNGTVTFTPNANFNGPGSFSYTATDGSATSNSAAVTVNVAAVNDAPTITVPSGNVNFSAAANSAVSVPEFAAIADFNGDGKMDLAVSNFFPGGQTVSILLGNGTGGFGAPVPYNVGISPSAIATGDFNADGKTDLAVVNQDAATTSILLGNGNGTFQPQTTLSTQNPDSVVIADVNADGKADLLVGMSVGNQISLFLGNGNGTFQTPTGLGSGYRIAQVAVADLNGDGKLDIVAAANPSTANGNGEAMVLLANGGGTFTAPTHFLTGGAGSAASLAIGDLNGDGKLDLALADVSENGVVVMLGTGIGGFGAPTRFGTVAPGNSTADIVIRDFNGDGKADLAVASGVTNGVYVLPGNGDGTFQPQLFFATGTNPQTVSAGDFNGDGRFDLIVPNVNGNTVSLLLNTSATTATSEDTQFALNGISFSDVDVGSDAMQVTLSVSHGMLSLASTTGLTGDLNGSDGLVLFTGSLGAINAALSAGLTYAPSANYYGADMLSIIADDLGHNGSGGPLPATQTVAITVTPVNDAPVAAITPLTYAATEQTSLTLKGTGLSVSDVDAGSGSVTATLSVGEGTLTMTAGGSGATVSGSGTSSVTINGTLAQVNALLSSDATSAVSYIDNTDTPSASTVLTLSVNDNGNTGTGGPLSASDTATINITAVDDAPVATITPLTYAATEQTSLVLKGTGLSVGDVDAGSGSVTATLSVGEGTLSATAGNSGAGVLGTGTASLTITGTLAQVNAFLGAASTSTLSYIDNTDTPSASTVLTLSVNDNGNTGSGGALSGSDTATINITAVNDPAAISGTTSGSVTEAGGVNNGTAGTPAATGTLTDTDVDNSANTFNAVAAGAATSNGYGTYQMTVGGVWTYTLDNANSSVQALNQSQTLTDSFTVSTVDGTQQVVTIAIHGATDSPTFSHIGDGGAIGGADHIVSSQTGDATVTGTVEAGGETVRLFTSAVGGTLLGTTVADGAGNWSYTLTSGNITTLGQSAGKTISAEAIDLSSNTSAPRSTSFAFAVDTVATTPAITSITLDGSNRWVVDGTAEANGTATIFDGGSQLATVAVSNGGTWTYNSSVTNNLIHTFTATAVDAAGNPSGASAAWIEGTPGNDIFPFNSEASLIAPAAIKGNGGSDTIAMISGVTLNAGDFTNVSNVQTLSLIGPNTVTLGADAAAAGVTKVITGSGATSITDSNGVTLNVDASALTANTGLTLAGSASEIVTGLIGDIAAASLTGALTVTTGNAIDNTISIVTGSATTSITDNSTGDTVSVNATALADNILLTTSGAANFTVTGLRGDLDATGVGGALNVTTVAVGGLSIATAGPTSSTIDATALTAGQTLTLTGSGGNGNFVTLNAGSLNASGSSRNLSVTGGTGANTITAGSGISNLITGGGGADVLTGGTGADTFAFNSAADLLAAATIAGAGGSDLIQMNAAAALTDAAFAHATSIETLGLSGASSVTLGANAASAGIISIALFGGSGPVTINSSNPGTLNVSAFINENTTLTLQGSTAENVSQIFGDINASALTGALSVTTRDATDNGIAITTGSAATSISASGTGDVITVNAAALANDTLLTLSGSAAESVTGLVGDLSATGLTGTLNVTTGNNTVDNDISITTGSAATSISASGAGDAITVDASGLASGVALTLTGSDAAVVTLNAGNLSAGAFTGNITMTAGTGANSISTGSGNDTINGGGGADTISADGGNDTATYYNAGTLDGGTTGETTGDTLIVTGAQVAGFAVDLSVAAGSDQTSGTGEVAIVKNFENVDASGATTAVSLTGSAGANTLIGGTVGDSIIGNGGSDTLTGSAGDDIIWGDALNQQGPASANLTQTALNDLVSGHVLVNGLGSAAGVTAGAGGTATFGENVVALGDDNSTAAILISSVFSSGLNFFGTNYTSLFINNNGNISFGAAVSTFTPSGIPAGTTPMIAPFWADVMTNSAPGTWTNDGGHSTGSDRVFYDLDTVNHIFTVTWDDVGYYNNHETPADSFQLQLIDEGSGNFDIVFRYENIGWTTGDASGGLNGLNNPANPPSSAAHAGYTSGDLVHFAELLQSGNQNALLALPTTTGNTGVTGEWVFQVRNGVVVDNNDRIVGGAGNDTLTGGPGNDTFVINSPSDGVDTITDFARGADVLEINAAAFGHGLVAGGTAPLISAADLASVPVQGANGYFILDTTNPGAGDLYWDATGGGATDATLLVHLTNVTTLFPSDFHLV
jgi:VCBS repeat-containing protein